MRSLWLTIQRQVTSRWFVALCGIYFIGIFSILRANRPYLDDLGRSLAGYTNWSTVARPLADFFAWIVYAGPITVDASPFTQLLAAAILALASLLLLDVLRLRPSWWSVLCVVPLGLSPYGLENLSYKFDAPSMALAMLSALVACRVLQRRGAQGILLAAAFLFISASLYQPSLGAYPCVAIYQAMRAAASRKCLLQLLRDLGRKILAFLLGVGIYALQAPLWVMHFGYGYAARHSEVPPLTELPQTLLKNSNTYFNILLRDWGANGLGMLFGAFVLLFGITLVTRLLYNHIRLKGTTRRALHHSIVRLVMILALFPCFLLAPAIVQIVLKFPVWAPRTLQAFGITIALAMLYLNMVTPKRILQPILRVFLIFMLFRLLIFAQVYGNLLAEQNRWELSRLAPLADVLSLYIKQTGSNRIAFNGSIGHSPNAETPMSLYPLLNRMVAVPLSGSWDWGYTLLATFGVALTIQDFTPELKAAPRVLILETGTYRIEQATDNIGVVTFLPANFVVRRQPAP